MTPEPIATTTTTHPLPNFVVRSLARLQRFSRSTKRRKKSAWSCINSSATIRVIRQRST